METLSNNGLFEENPPVTSGLPSQRANKSELWCFSNCKPEQACEQVVEFLVIWYAITHWGRVTHIWISYLTSIVSDKRLSPGQRQAIICNNAGILLIGPLGTNFSEILIKIHIFLFKKMHLKMSSGKWWPFYLGLNVLKLMWHQFMTVASGRHHHLCPGDD